MELKQVYFGVKKVKIHAYLFKKKSTSMNFLKTIYTYLKDPLRRITLICTKSLSFGVEFSEACYRLRV